MRKRALQPPKQELIDAYIRDLELDIADIDKNHASDPSWVALADKYRAEIAAIKAADYVVIDDFGIPQPNKWPRI